MNAPPDYIVRAARDAALKSPCAKSARGVVLFDRDQYERLASSTTAWGGPVSAIEGTGFNGQPTGFACNDTAACRENCAKLCIHAEQRAIMQALVHSGDRETGCSMGDLELVHVKVVDGQVVAGGGPSCWQCSRLVVEVGLRGVWLYEARQIAEASHGGMHPEITWRSGEPGRWRFYTADEFHRETLRACGIGDANG